ncbi:type IV toxin-antitoxin system AbiEi family antitoxin domain-containing protein [Enemella evansiae]|uniref:type IV toxin-antitoxin system AbiEi family antitoxin domain-containing protein n=1 Tax=Enemella evansiae TaxID=2016499 RepID=UPI0010603A46|nr:type IV toxin-antitoxin system AbiEi family antitoxin domain-containing protein [Enemella evansiae]TDO85404.1 putative AbiEi antitoxin of type IV toxin-antitoxin system [Enemella evansiae]
MQIVTTAELLAEGLRHPDIRHLVDIGELHRVRRGAYLRGPDQRLVAEQQHRALIQAVAAAHPDAVLSHVSAAVLHDLPVPLRSLARVHLTKQGRNTGSKRLDRSYLHRVTQEIPTVVVEELVVTDLPTTVLDLIRALQPADAVAVADRALALGLDRAELLERIGRERGRRGNANARRVLLFADRLAESAGESWTRWAFHCAGLPAPKLQVEFFDHRGVPVARVDFDWPEWGVCAEFDGEIKYGRLLRPGQGVADVIRAEKSREEELRRASGRWLVRVITRELDDLAELRRTILDAAGHAARRAG